MAVDLFLSYASPDRPLAERICTDLEADGLTCWIAPRDVPAGGDYAQVIPDAIAGSAILVLLFSSAAVASPHVEREVHLAGGLKTPILPLRLDATEPTGSLQYFLVNAQRIDLFPRPETQFGRIRAEVRRLLDQQGVGRAPTPGVSPFQQVVASAIAWTIVVALSLAVVGWLWTRWFNLVPAWRLPIVAATTKPVALLLVGAVPLAAFCLQYWAHRSLRRLPTLDAVFAVRGSPAARIRTLGAAAAIATLAVSTATAAPPVSIDLERAPLDDFRSTYTQARTCMSGSSYVVQSTTHFAVRTRIGSGNPPGTYVRSVELAPYATSDGVEFCEIWIDQRVETISVEFSSVDERRAAVFKVTGRFGSEPTSPVLRFNARHYRDSQPAADSTATASLTRDGFTGQPDHETLVKSIWATQ